MTTTETPTSRKTGKPLMFEAETCGRCGGSGHYSYCQSHGTRCFGCQGHGIRLTKRGAAAQAMYRDLLTARADEVQVGDLIHDSGVPGYIAGRGFCKVTAIEPKPAGTMYPDCDAVRISADGFGYNGPVHAKLRIGRSAEFKREAKETALAYQETLTKAGKARKR
jgi:hypothetical protein